MNEILQAERLAGRLDTSRFLPNVEVVDELMASPLPREGRAFILAASVETMLPGPNNGPLRWPYAWSQFRCLFGFVEWQGQLTAFPAWAGRIVGSAQTHAAGFLQDEPATYRGIARITKVSSFMPAAQITNNWALAQRDFQVRTGEQLLARLQAGELDLISRGLIATWPEGCDANFPPRYTHALALFP